MASQDLTAYQLFYSRIEASAFRDIPHVDIRRSGFQVLYHAPEIAEDVAEIERRVQCFQPKRDEERVIRFQFFTTSSGKVVISHTIGIDAHPEITDPNQRPGAFIAHCLVFTAADFRRASNDPFHFIFNESYINDGTRTKDIFIIDPVDMREVVRNNQQSIPVRVERTARRDVGNYGNRRENLNQLVNIGRRGLGDQTLAFLGDSVQDVEDLMELMIKLTPMNERLKLSFDTLIDGCPPVPGAYFAVGANRRVSNSKFINVDVDLNNPNFKVDVSDPKETGYSNWLRHSLTNNSLETTLVQAPQVQRINDVFEAGNLLEGEIDAVAVDAFIDVNEKLILQRFKDAFATHFSASIVNALYDDVLARNAAHITGKDVISIAAHQDIYQSVTSVVPELYDLIIRHHIEKLKDSELKVLRELGELANHLPLQAIPMLNDLQGWTIASTVQNLVGQSPEEKKRVEIVNKLVKSNELLYTMDDLSRFKWGHPSQFITDESTSTIVEFLAQNQEIDDKERTNLIITLIKEADKLDLDPLTDQLGNFDSKHIKKISKAISKSDGKVGKKFVKRIEEKS